MALLKGLAGLGVIHPTQVQANPPVASTAPKTGGNVLFLCFLPSFVGFVMTSTEHDMLTMFLKLKPPVFLGSETEDAYELILDCYERLHKLDIVL